MREGRVRPKINEEHYRKHVKELNNFKNLTGQQV